MAIALGSRVLYGLTVVGAVLALVTLALMGGYDHIPAEMHSLRSALHWIQAVFVAHILFEMIFEPRRYLSDTRAVKWIFDGAILLYTAMLAIDIHQQVTAPVAAFLRGRYFFYAVMFGYSVVELSSAMMSLTRRRTNPSLLLSGSFIFFILLGSLVLMLPRFTTTPISYIDSLFVATSAVCITGLTPVDIAATFTPWGYIVLCLLFQVGALGVLTFTCFFAIFFSGAPSVYNQLLISDMIYSKTMNALVPTLLYILGFTLVIEALGAVAVYFTIPAGMIAGDGDKVMFAVFHAISSFCNVGYSCLPDGMANPALMDRAQGTYLVTCVLVVAGGIGFPILVNFKDILHVRLRKVWLRLRGKRSDCPVHLYDLNTKLVLVTYFAILAVASLAFFCLEYNNTLAGMTLWQKVVQSVFNSLTPRSAGFASVDIGAFLPLTLLLVMVQMWIGGASQSLAGGVKVNTVAAVVLNVRSVLHGSSRPRAFQRSISVATTRRANAVVILSVMSYIVVAAALLLLEPQLQPKALLFEALSALFTVGSSLGVTASLGTSAKIVLCLAMFAGRVGIISILTGLIRPSRDLSMHLPEENLIIS